MNDTQFEEQEKIKKDIDARYLHYINELILFRFRVVASIGIALYLAFIVIDHIAYPANAAVFLNIRLIATAFAVPILLISFVKNIRPFVPWLSDAGCTTYIIGMAIMVFISDGSSSRYYEGANLIFLAFSIMNPFYIGHLACCLLTWIGFFDIAMLYGHGSFNMLNFIYANYFMGSTALFVFLLSKFYKDQHYKAFVRQEHLKINEETLAALYSQADKLSKTDTLTAINNRRHFSDMLLKKIEGCEATKTHFYLVIFDVDHFKELNDTYGHILGDTVLIKIVEAVKNNVRSHDFIGRFGGDEFIICLDLPHKEGLLSRLTKISAGVRSLGLTYDGKEIPISASIGASKFIPGTNMTEEILIEKADFELFNVKKNERGKISVDQ